MTCDGAKILAGAAMAGMLLLISGCAVAHPEGAPSYDDIASTSESYKTAFCRLEAATEAADAALVTAFDCVDLSCREVTLQAADRALETENDVYLEFSRAMDERMSTLIELTTVEPEACRSCSRFVTATDLQQSAERMFQRARTVENALYLEFLGCDTDTCRDRVQDRLEREAVPRRADAAQTLNDAQQQMFDAESAMHQEMADANK
ncbi:MAG: hypothetical protein OXB92_10055 [Acidimicrobiaceae bacterium]|nr:hypothetical protein [Acidimicrobiia bacterium]MCY4494186.1 hypothetical protein [Acidimicrobiaceae bacterium]